MKDVKIGIITFQRAHNYGAILQCYALQEILLANHYDVKVIDYYPKAMHYYHYFQWKRFFPWHPRRMIKNIVGYSRRKKRYKAFNEFIEKRLKLSYSNQLHSLSQDYDVIIIGSDQLWNPRNSSGRYDNYYWGKFKENNRPKIISYAVSMGKAWKFVDWSIVKDLLNNFDAVSVREDYLKDIIKEKCGRQAVMTLDPTLLQDRAFWMKQSKDLGIEKPYLLFYQARANKDAYKYAKIYAKAMHLNFICLSADIMSNNSSIAIDAAPVGFLNLIRNANYVLTTSFHGTVFCYQFRKNFSTIKLEDGDDGRSLSFLRMLGMEERLVSLKEKPIQTKADWNLADSNIIKIREFSLNWLFDNLKFN